MVSELYLVYYSMYLYLKDNTHKLSNKQSIFKLIAYFILGPFRYYTFHIEYNLKARYIKKKPHGKESTEVWITQK